MNLGTMGSNLDEPRGPFYSLFILIIIIISSLSLPFRFQSFGSNFTKFLDTNDKIYIFLFCNGILFYLFFDSGSNQAKPEAKETECNEISVSSVDDHKDYLLTHDQVEDLVVVHVRNEHEFAVDVKQNGMLVGVDDHCHDRIEDLETEHVHEEEDEMVAMCDVEDEEEHDDEDEANDFRQKCEAFIQKVRQNMHCEQD
ncbi:hypothetical protein HanIR_Chr11g0510131 [Helianthus annuus]|nr:hypothetical protein HanIR_Chr11g0510131 [Helianthus annuus]